MAREIEDVLNDLARGLAALEEAKPGYEEAREFYDGTDAEVLISEELRRLLRGQATSFGLNLAAVPVDTVANRLFIASITSPDEEVQAAIDLIIDSNDFFSWSNGTMRQSQMFGDMYVYVWPGSIEGTVDIAQMDPLTTRVIYDTEFERVPLFAVRSWEEGQSSPEKGKLCYATIAYPDEVYKFVKNQQSKKWESRVVVDDEGQEEPWPLRNEFNQLPYGHLRNALPYGTPGHKKAYGTQRLITKNRASMAANMDWMTLPQRYFLMHPEEQGGAPNDLPLTTADGAVTATDTRRNDEIKVRPGSVIREHAKGAGQFDPADPQGYIQIEDNLKMDMASATSMPLRLFSDNSGQQPSGDSQRENDRPLRTMVRTTRGNLAAGWIGIFRAALNILGFPNAEVNVEWERDEVANDATALEAADSVTSLVERALVNPQLRPIVEHKLSELGYSREEILAFFGEEQEAVTVSGDPSQVIPS